MISLSRANIVIQIVAAISLLLVGANFAHAHDYGHAHNPEADAAQAECAVNVTHADDITVGHPAHASDQLGAVLHCGAHILPLADALEITLQTAPDLFPANPYLLERQHSPRFDTPPPRA